MSDEPSTPYAALLRDAGLSHTQAGFLVGATERRSRRMVSGREEASPFMLAILSVVASAKSVEDLGKAAERLLTFAHYLRDTPVEADAPTPTDAE